MSKRVFDIIAASSLGYAMRKTTPAAKVRKKSAARKPRHPGSGPAPGARKTAKVPASEIKVTPVRLEPELRAGLALLQGTLKMTMNKLINQAVDELISRRTAVVEADLEAMLRKVKAYRKRDPGFKRAIRATAEAEARASSEGLHDPAQGTISRHPRDDVGPAQSMVRQLLSNR